MLAKILYIHNTSKKKKNIDIIFKRNTSFITNLDLKKIHSKSHTPPTVL